MSANTKGILTYPGKDIKTIEFLKQLFNCLKENSKVKDICIDTYNFETYMFRFYYTDLPLIRVYGDRNSFRKKSLFVNLNCDLDYTEEADLYPNNIISLESNQESLEIVNDVITKMKALGYTCRIHKEELPYP